MRKKTIMTFLAVPTLVLMTACGGDADSADGDADGAAAVDATVPDATEMTVTTEGPGPVATEGEAPRPTAADDAAGDDASGSGSGGTAVLTLSNGEVFEFDGLLCSLEPQMSAGSEILFTAVSYGDPGLDITQFGTEGTVTDVASISVYDGEYNSLWDANSMFGTPVELSLDGTTITGTGSFIPDDDIAQPAVEGTVTANC